jgi:hypothetical protein
LGVRGRRALSAPVPGAILASSTRVTVEKLPLRGVCSDSTTLPRATSA